MSSVSEKPVCECHGEPMGWIKDARGQRGGYWRCAVKHREGNRRWREANPDKCREQQREHQRRWREANPDKKRADNATRMFVCGMYLGKCGFTDNEIKEMTSGASH